MAFSDWLIIGGLGLLLKKGINNAAEEREQREREYKHYEEERKNREAESARRDDVEKNERTLHVDLKMALLMMILLRLHIGQENE